LAEILHALNNLDASHHLVNAKLVGIRSFAVVAKEKKGEKGGTDNAKSMW
jgi:hypothetical protein